MTSPFLDLPIGNLEHLVDNIVVDISLNPHFYEEKMAQELGSLPLSLPMLNKYTTQVLTFCDKLVFKNFDPNKKETMVMHKYSSLNVPCFMNVENVSQLLQFASFVYQVSYANYIVMQREYSSFPYNLCGLASENVSLALQLHGFPNTVWLYDVSNDHAYVGLPFVMQQTNEKGFILLDPTSDQLWKAKNPRNIVSIVSGTKWEYITEYANKNDLYPTMVQHIGTMKKRKVEKWYGPESMANFLDQVFKNQVSVDIYCSSKN